MVRSTFERGKRQEIPTRFFRVVLIIQVPPRAGWSGSALWPFKSWRCFIYILLRDGAYQHLQRQKSSHSMALLLVHDEATHVLINMVPDCGHFDESGRLSCAD